MLTRDVHDALVDARQDSSTAGACVETSTILSCLLARAGVEHARRSGSYTVAWKRDHTGPIIRCMDHAWVRLADGTILDPTRDQFEPRSRARRLLLVVAPGEPGYDLWVDQGMDLWWPRTNPVATAHDVRCDVEEYDTSCGIYEGEVLRAVCQTVGLGELLPGTTEKAAVRAA